jgi:hypothetical protein
MDKAETYQEAIALARDWAEGRRSWTNLGGVNPEAYPDDVIAVMDAQEVVKWSALAVALLAGEGKPDE